LARYGNLKISPEPTGDFIGQKASIIIGVHYVAIDESIFSGNRLASQPEPLSESTALQLIVMIL